MVSFSKKNKPAFIWREDDDVDDDHDNNAVDDDGVNDDDDGDDKEDDKVDTLRSKNRTFLVTFEV